MGAQEGAADAVNIPELLDVARQRAGGARGGAARWKAGFDRARIRIACAAAGCALAAGCAVAPHAGAPHASAGMRAEDHAVLDVGRMLDHEWQSLRLRGNTDYRIVAVDGRLAIRAAGRRSASGLVRRVHIDPARCPRLAWSWRVDALQGSADLRRRSGDDVAASVFVLFGDPGFLADPDPVPTLRYVWTNERLPAGTVVDNPYMPGIVRSLVVRSGSEHLGQWVLEHRDLTADYRLAFGRPPDAHVEAVALYTDNDQTAEPVTSYYEWIRAECDPGTVASARRPADPGALASRAR